MSPEEHEDLIQRVISEVRPYSVVPNGGLECTIAQAIEAIEADIPGILVECGVFKGGSSFAMLLAQRYFFGEIRRPVWMYDSFEGMGELSPEDGGHGRWWKERSVNSSVDPDGVNFCIAPIEEVQEAAAALDLTDHVTLIKGWYHDTLPIAKPEKIAVLRVDCDWYEPCQLVYRELVPLVSEGGRIIVDDYYAWEGCTLATHEYLAEHKLPWYIRSAADLCGMYMIKGPATW